MPKCSSCLNNEVSFKELFKGKIMCSECEQRLSKINTDSYEVTNNESMVIPKPTPKQTNNPLGGCLVVFIILFGISKCATCIDGSDKKGKSDTSQVERVELPNGQVQFNVGSGKKSEVKEVTEEKTEKETTLYKIPDLVSYDVYSRFLKAGFNDMGKDIGRYGCFWTFNYEDDKGMYYLRVYGNNPNEVQVIDASFTGESIKAAKFYLTEVAKTNYTGSDSNEAAQFISKNINRNAETKIGGIGFRLISNRLLSL